jgi:tetratricopeptide (TPR) repeat protein
MLGFIPSSEERDMDRKRRRILQNIGAAGASAFVLPIGLMSSEPWDRLAGAFTKSTRLDSQVLTHLEQLNECCWHLGNSNQLGMVAQILPSYLPKASALAQQPSEHQARAASLASRGYILAAEVDKSNILAMQAYAQQAVLLSQIANDDTVRVDALRQEATIALVAKQPLKALVTYQAAIPLLADVSPLLRSRIYLGLASASARCGQKQEALRSLGLAQDHFPDNPEQDPNYLYIYSAASKAVLHLYEALTYNDLQRPQAAWDALMQVDGLHPKMPVLESARIEFVNLQAKTSANLGNMDESASYLEAAVQAADTAGYPVWREEAQEIYQGLFKRWPHEKQVRQLGELFL